MAEGPSIDRLAIANPVLIVEVTSPSTEAYDRGEKLNHYQRIPSLQAVLFVSHRERRLTVTERVAGEWRSTDFSAGQRAVVAAKALSFDVDDIYAVLQELG